MANHGRKFARALALAALCLLLGGCATNVSTDKLYALPSLPAEYASLEAEINALLSDGAEHAAPISGSNLQSVQMVDLDGDGVEEAVAFFRKATDERPVKIYFFRSNGDSYEQMALIEGTASSIYSITYYDLDGDGRREILVGFKSGTELQVLAVYTLRGSGVLRDTLCGLSFDLSPRSFYQVNPVQAERLYAKALEYAAPEGRGTVLDLYCGAGTISLCLARGAERVIGAEIVPEAVENARENARRNGVHNAEFLCADAGEAAAELLRRGVKPDAVVVDPPRKGLSPEVIDCVCAMAPERVVYVSCGAPTLARDAKLLAEGGYAAERVQCVDMFGHSVHVETVVLLERK